MSIMNIPEGFDPEKLEKSEKIAKLTTEFLHNLRELDGECVIFLQGESMSSLISTVDGSDTNHLISNVMDYTFVSTQRLVNQAYEDEPEFDNLPESKKDLIAVAYRQNEIRWGIITGFHNHLNYMNSLDGSSEYEFHELDELMNQATEIDEDFERFLKGDTEGMSEEMINTFIDQAVKLHKSKNSENEV